ncbi:MAG TPA: hypothetical protein VIQ11_10655 [Mycobacterium sp.]
MSLQTRPGVWTSARTNSDGDPTGPDLPASAASTHTALLQLMMEVVDPAWAPQPAAARLINGVDDLDILRIAHQHLQQASVGDVSLSQARALATLNVVIYQLDTSRSFVPTPLRPKRGPR